MASAPPAETSAQSANSSPKSATTAAQPIIASARSIGTSAHPTIAGVLPVPSTARRCYFTDELSAEIRIHIYGFVFGSGERARRIRMAETLAAEEEDENDDENDEDLVQIDTEWIPSIPDNIAPKTLHQIPTDILSVNKLIYKESVEALYNNRIISATFSEFDKLLQLNHPRGLLRNVEIVSCNSGIHYTGHIQNLLKEVPRLPRLKTFVIWSDCLARTADPAQHTTVRQFALRYHVNDVVCTDIGRYSVPEFPKVTFAHEKILRMWPDVASTPDDYDAINEAISLVNNTKVTGPLSNIMAWASHHSLRLWVGLVQKFFERVILAPDNDEEVEGTGLKEHTILGAFHRTTIGSLAIPAKFPLCKLRSHHDEKDLLEYITEMLSENIQSYVPDLEGGREARQPRWVELGQESELHRQDMFQAKLRQQEANRLRM